MIRLVWKDNQIPTRMKCGCAVGRVQIKSQTVTVAACSAVSDSGLIESVMVLI